MTAAANWTHLLDEAITKPGLLLKAYNAFHNYSIGNQVLAIVQCHQREIEPGPLSTFPGWKEKGRYVKKGERALMLCMPITCRDKEGSDPDARFTRFVYKNRWFVLSQTEGEEVPSVEIPAWDRQRALQTLGIEEIPFDTTNGNAQGFSRKRSIAISPLAVLPHKTTFHELGHVLLGHTAEADFSDAEALPRSLQEVEAESVALICCETLELPGAEYARGYIQNWMGGGSPIPEHSAQRIFRVADQILKAGTPAKGDEKDA